MSGFVAVLIINTASFKQRTGGLVVVWSTTSEYPLLYIFVSLLLVVRREMLTARLEARSECSDIYVKTASGHYDYPKRSVVLASVNTGSSNDFVVVHPHG